MSDITGGAYVRRTLSCIFTLPGPFSFCGSHAGSGKISEFPSPTAEFQSLVAAIGSGVGT